LIPFDLCEAAGLRAKSFCLITVVVSADRINISFSGVIKNEKQQNFFRIAKIKNSQSFDFNHIKN